MNNIFSNIAFVFPTGNVMPSRISNFLNVSVSEFSAMPVYFSSSVLPVFYKNFTYWTLTFSLFFSENPGYWKSTFGYHAADVERVVLLFDTPSCNTTPAYVYFGAHSRAEGTMVPWEQCDKHHSTGALLIYVSKRSNAFYPKPGRYVRIFGFANDVCVSAKSKSATIWFPTEDDFEKADNQTWSASHRQVAKGINSPMYVAGASERSILWWERFFLAIPFVRNRVKAIRPL